MSCPTASSIPSCQRSGGSAIIPHSPCYRSPRDFGAAFRRFLYGKNVFSLLDVPGLECGWMDGGCRILGDAIRRWLGPEHVQLYQLSGSRGAPEHVVARLGEFYLDGDGVSSEKKLLRRWDEAEGVPDPRLSPADEAELDKCGIPSDAEISERLAALLGKKFNAQAVTALLDPSLK